MRSTVRIDDDLMTELKARAREEGLSLTRMLNRALRQGLRREHAPAEPYRHRSFAMGPPGMDLDKALALAGGLEDEETLRKVLLSK